MLIMEIKSIKNRENIKHISMKIKTQGYLTTLYMVLFQSSFVILCSTYGSLQKFGCNWSAMGKEINSSLDSFTEQTILVFYLPHLLHTASQNLLCCEIFNISLKRLSYQFLAFRDLYIQTNLITNSFKNPSIIHHIYNIHHIDVYLRNHVFTVYGS